MFWVLIMKIFGWKIDKDFPKNLKRCVLIAAPHTSNWDFLFAIATFRIMKIDIKFTIKEEWTRFPFGIITKPLGAIGINRKPKTTGDMRKSMVESMSDLYQKNKDLVLIVTAEGTRAKVDEWKSGFYHIAKNAQVPIALGYLNYKEKIAGIGKDLIFPSDSLENDMKKIMMFYSNAQPKIPKNFALDHRYI